VYVEKPMTVNSASAKRMADAAKEKNIKLSVAHYRREMPLFKKIKQLLAEKRIGDIRFVKLDLYKKSVSKEEMAIPMRAWRVNAAVAGGGLFHDLSPHQLDLMYYYFGEIDKASGFAVNQEQLYNADDIVLGDILFKSGVLFSGIWCFNAAEEKDQIEIIGSKGKIAFSVFEMEKISITENGKTEVLTFDQLPHVQQPLIEKIVEYFLGKGPNPCSGEDGVTIMQLIDKFTVK
ncbi:MAG: Gfo/Idh/MocA family oxidoreductase, partial [Chitinophagaceae bacterium]